MLSFLKFNFNGDFQQKIVDMVLEEMLYMLKCMLKHVKCCILKNTRSS